MFTVKHVRAYRLYYARGGIIVIILGSCQALQPSTGLCYVEGHTLLYFSLVMIIFVFDDNHRPLGSSGVLCGSP